jgi:hypothetical protein
MIIALLGATFAIAFIIASVVAIIFHKPTDNILKRIVPDDLSYAWTRYLKFAIYVVGIGGGVRVWSLERYFPSEAPGTGILTLTPERWMLEIYQAIIGTLQSTAWILLVFFLFALIGVVIVRIFEGKAAKTGTNIEGNKV